VSDVISGKLLGHLGPLQCSLQDFCLSAGVQKVPSRTKETLAPFVNFPKMRPFYRKTFINQFWWMTKKNKKWSSLFPTRTHTTVLIYEQKKSS